MRPLTRYILAGSVLAVLIFGGFVFRKDLALAALAAANGFFGGSLPYNLFLADLSFRTALVLDSQAPDAWHQRARIAFLAGNFDAARRLINRQLEVHGDELMASYYIRGLIEGYAKNYSDAERDFSRFIAWDPGNWAAHNDLAWVYFAQGKYAEAKEEAARGLSSNPTNPWLLMTHAMARFNLGERDGVLEELERAKSHADGLTPSGWGRAYPGNDPASAARGLEAFRASIAANIDLVYKATADK